MIKINGVDVFGWQAAMRGMRNPMNSWAKSDSAWVVGSDPEPINPNDFLEFQLGPNDLDLAMRLAKAGSVHAKYRRMIVVQCDILAPLYWWKEFDTYKVGTVANSCSTMHKIAAKEFTLEDFSYEHLINSPLIESEPGVPELLNMQAEQMLVIIVGVLNAARYNYLKTKDKKYWWQMIQLLPTSYNQRRTVQMSYEVLAGMYRDRKNHKLDEWRDFCKWVETLPYSEIITGGDAE